MGLTRPTLLQVPAFDAKKPYIFQFVVQGAGSQVVANKLTIREQDTNRIVYIEKQETYAYQHIVNANELINGKYYNATLSVFDNQNNESPQSIPIQFYCYTTPVVSFTNLPFNNIITNSSFNFQFTYTQLENEPLNSFIVNLYNDAGIIVASSETQYVENGIPPYNGNYEFEGFANATQYGIEIKCLTINQTEISTGVFKINVNYAKPDIISAIQLTNNCEEGYIYIKSNIIFIEGNSNPVPPIYIDNKEVDLTNPDHWVEWNKGYNISGDFLARIWFRKPNPYSQILEFSNISGQTIKINYMLGYENEQSETMKSYVECYVNYLENASYYIYSNFINTLPDNEYYCMWLKRENNIYKLELGQKTN